MSKCTQPYDGIGELLCLLCFLFLNLPPKNVQKQVLENNSVISAHLSVTEMVHGLVDSLARCNRTLGETDVMNVQAGSRCLGYHLLVIVFGIVSYTFGKWICY